MIIWYYNQCTDEEETYFVVVRKSFWEEHRSVDDKCDDEVSEFFENFGSAELMEATYEDAPGLEEALAADSRFELKEELA